MTTLTRILLCIAVLLGALLYFAFGPRRPTRSDVGVAVDEDAVPVYPEGRSWNPIQGENRIPDGEGMNPERESPPPGGILAGVTHDLHGH